LSLTGGLGWVFGKRFVAQRYGYGASVGSYFLVVHFHQADLIFLKYYSIEQAADLASIINSIG
jgi:hypothetical protein